MNYYLLDTNIVIYYLGNVSEVVNFFDVLYPQNNKFFFSFISRIELLGYKNLNQKEKNAIRDFFSDLEKSGMNEKIEEITIEIQKQKRIKIPDAIIASTALYTNSTLVTRNTKDFEGIENLELFNPFEEDISKIIT